jgi:hypothetical protein
MGRSTTWRTLRLGRQLPLIKSFKVRRAEIGDRRNGADDGDYQVKCLRRQATQRRDRVHALITRCRVSTGDPRSHLPIPIPATEPAPNGRLLSARQRRSCCRQSRTCRSMASVTSHRRGTPTVETTRDIEPWSYDQSPAYTRSKIR